MSTDWIPPHLAERVAAMRERLLEHGKYRPTKRGKPLPEWKVSIAGARAALLLEDLLHGLHHLPRRQHPSDIDWSLQYVTLPFGGISTFDFDDMTRLVILAHEHCIRAEITPSNPQYMRLLLHPRIRLDGQPFQVMHGHPSLENLATRVGHAIERCNKHNAEDSGKDEKDHG